MKAVDTNIVIRLLTRDDESQYRQAYDLLQSETIFIASTVILKSEWVLSHAYGFPPDRVNRALELLLGLPQVELDRAHQVAQAPEWHRQGMDFVDALHLATSQPADQFITFDQKPIAKAAGLAPLPVKAP